MRVAARERLQVALGRVLRLRRTELGRALRMAGLAIVLGCGMYTAFNGTQAIFLVRTGARAYPAFFIVLAVSVWPAITALAAANRRWGPDAAFRYNLALNAVVPLTVYLAYRLAENTVVSFLAIVVYSVAFEVLMIQFWAFVGQYFDIQEAKRVYPVIAAGSGLGYIFAGALTTVVAEVSGQPELLVLGWAAGCAASVPIAAAISRRLRRPVSLDVGDPFGPEEGVVVAGTLHGLRDAFGYLQVSRLVLALVLLGTVLLVVMRVSDYLVALVFVDSTRNVTELSVLLGNAWMLSYLVQIALGLWVTPWLLARAGIKNAILALPVATLAGFSLVALSPRLAAALFLFVVRNGLQTGVDDPARNVLDGALPEQVRPRLALLQDNLVLPGSAALTGIGLAVIAAFFGSASVLFLAWLGIVVALLFLACALWVRGLYVGAVFQRLRSHTLSLDDLELAVGLRSLGEVSELRGYLAGDDPEIRRFAATALSRVSGEGFAELAPELVLSADPALRRLAFELSPAGALGEDLLAIGAADRDPWVVAAAAVAGSRSRPPWARSGELLARLRHSPGAPGRSAAAWAASFTGELEPVQAALADPRAAVRLEAVRSLGRMRSETPGTARSLLTRIGDKDLEVRRETLRQLGRWAAPAAAAEDLGPLLVECLGTGDPVSQHLAGEAISVQCPAALEAALPLLEGEPRIAVAVLEAIFRSGRVEMIAAATRRLEAALAAGELSADHSHRLGRFGRLGGPGSEDQRWAGLRVALDDHREQTIEVCLAALRSLHDKRGFARVERGLRSGDPAARAVAIETLLNFGPPRLVEPLARLLDPGRLEVGAARPLREVEIGKLEKHPHEWVRRAVADVGGGRQESMKDLVALKGVPLFATLSLEQLASIDRLMVTRSYEAGEQIFKWGDLSSELYVVLQGSVRIHRDQGGRQVTLARLGPNSFMGEMAPFTDEPRSAGAEAVEPTTVRVLRKDRLGAILHEHPEVLMEVIKNLSRRLMVANTQLEEAARARAEIEPTSGPQASSRR
ncbi:MAG TPA: Npt1/Npt2 family nucleotide transporter [Candidatus Dormibacteraeota bacterium]|nr:Npt1/Npt2 family nucleotide transporter [Candidatus Dormibacteraeota bacterium]